MMFGILLAIVVQLSGVSGEDLSARAFFDVNNVKVGDPLVLTVDFVGSADFQALHPPALSRCVNSKDWKLDDRSAKTDTFRDARRLTYRVRPMRKGVLWFPAIDFEYDGIDGKKRIARSNEIPVHSKAGTQVVVKELGEDINEMPLPAPLCVTPPDGLGEDELFAWRRACSNPSAAAFADFQFPQAKLNEAVCSIREGSWAKALGIYNRLEWRIGQTPEIEKGIVAALALKYDNPHAELPVWRQVLRPVLQYDWRGRLGIVLGTIAAIALLFWLLGRLIKMVACVGIALLLVCLPNANAQDLFQQMHEQMQRMQQQMDQQMQQMSSGFSMRFGGTEREPVKIVATLATDSKVLQVGDGFNFIVSLEYPRNCSVGQISMTPSEMFGLTVTGQVQNLEDGKSANPSNVVKRLAVPVRYDVPFNGSVSFRIEGMVSGRQTRNRGSFSFTFSNSFSCETQKTRVNVRPLPGANQPADFAGIIADVVRIHEYPDIVKVETNDVIKLSYRMYVHGYVPKRFLPKDVAYEWSRREPENGEVEVEFVRYLVADGVAATPELSISYYNPKKKTYERAKTGKTSIKYTEANDGKKTD